MEREIRIYILALLLGIMSFAALSAQSASSATTSAKGIGAYCTGFFTNSDNIVSSAFENGIASTGILSLALLIVLFVLVCLSVVYGVGMAFGINKLTEFAKTEYLESFFNIVFIVVIAGGLAAFTGYAQFFTSIATTSLPGVTAPSLSGGYVTLYENICTDLVNSQVIPSLTSLLLVYFTQLPYSWAASLHVSIAFQNIPSAGLASIFLPSVSFSPLKGLELYNSVILFEFAPLGMILFLGISIIFLFYIIYFLFPVFLYLGILFRSFPWTRAAGGSMLAIFISFYIIFPALYYPFSYLGTTTVSSIYSPSALQQQICRLQVAAGSQTTTAGTAGSLNGGCLPTSSVLTYSNVFIPAITTFFAGLVSIFTGGGSLFISVIDVFVSIIAVTVVKLLGLAIAFVISFDLLEALGDLLGAPSLQSDRLLSRVI